MIFDTMMSDEAVLQEIGQRIAKQRVVQGYSQAYMAEQAGVSKRTVERLEAGFSTQTATFIRVIRILGFLNSLEQLIPETGPSPMDLLKLKGKERKRASTGKKKKEKKKETPWRWGDE